MMTPMQVTLDTEARRKLKQGVDILASAVKSTLGPKGRNVIIQEAYKNIHITKDGVTVAKSIFLEDPIQNLGAQILKQAADKTNQLAGDGTTTATVLAQAILHQGLKLVENGANPIDLKRGIEKATKVTTELLREKSISIQDDWDKVKQVATISANNDEEIGSLVAQAFQEVGASGVVAVDKSNTPTTHITITEGMEYSRGYASPYFVNKPKKMVAEYEDVLIFVTDKKLRSPDDVVHVLNIAAEQQRPILLIADDIEGAALQVLVLNRVKGGLPIIATKAPAFGTRRKKLLEDIAILTGATLITEDAGLTPQDTSYYHLGQATKITSNSISTTIVDGQGHEELLSSRCEEIKTEIQQANSDYEKEKASERLAKLQSGVAVINVGAHTELELNEKKDRIDDAINATRAALKEGIIPGGGCTYYKLALELMNIIAKEHLSNINRDEYHGVEIVEKALREPLKCIISNAGFDPGSETHDMNVVDEDEDYYWRKGFNVDQPGRLVDLIESGIIDPTKVAISALQSASSVASLILMTQATINPKESELNTNKSPMSEHM